MWRRTERASLEKKPSIRLSQEPCLGVKVKSNLPAGCSASQARVSLEICAEFPIVGDYGYRIGWFRLRLGCGLLQQLHFAINAEHFGHLFRKLGVAALQVIPDFMRLHLLLVEDLAHSALRQMGEARVPLRRSMLASVTDQKPRSFCCGRRGTMLQ
jgi:hypothetical protein